MEKKLTNEDALFATNIPTAPPNPGIKPYRADVIVEQDLETPPSPNTARHLSKERTSLLDQIKNMHALKPVEKEEKLADPTLAETLRIAFAKIRARREGGRSKDSNAVGEEEWKQSDSDTGSKAKGNNTEPSTSENDIVSPATDTTTQTVKEANHEYRRAKKKAGLFRVRK